jgi:hypothetical protein
VIVGECWLFSVSGVCWIVELRGFRVFLVVIRFGMDDINVGKEGKN